MRRRDFVAFLSGAAAAAPLAALGQRAPSLPVVAVLMAYASNDREAAGRVDGFVKELARLGWADGRNIRIEYRWAGGDLERYKADAAELAAFRPAVIFAATTPVVRTLLNATRTIPIVFVSVSDPVGDKFVTSLAQPGGNATGFINIESSMAGKWVELLKEVVPATARVSMLFNPRTAAGQGRYFLGPFDQAARSLGVDPIILSVQEPGELEHAVASVAGKPTGALIVMPDSFNVVHRARIISLAARHGVPAVYPYRYMAQDGGLMSYGVDLLDMYKRAASYVDRILRGTPPHELPIQAPVKFELVINTRTAKALGIQVSPSLLARADEVLE